MSSSKLNRWSRILHEKLSASSGQAISRILLDGKFHYQIDKSTPLVPVLCKVNPVHGLPNNSFQLHSNLILRSTSRSSKCLQIYYSNDATAVCNYLTYRFLSTDRKLGRDTYFMTPTLTALMYVNAPTLVLFDSK